MSDPHQFELLPEPEFNPQWPNRGTLPAAALACFLTGEHVSQIGFGTQGRDMGERSANTVDDKTERLLPLETWLHENARMRSIWRFGSPRLTGPADMGKWLRRHEARLTERGAVLRLGKA